MLQTQDEAKTMIEAPVNLSRFSEFLCLEILLTLKVMKLQQIYSFLKAEVQKKFS